MHRKQRSVHNFPKNYPWYKKVLANIIFFFASTFTSRPKNITPSDQVTIRNIIKAGDIILVGGKKGISSMVIGGLFTHIIMYLGDNMVAHAPQPDGVRTDALNKILNTYDALVIVRPSYTKENRDGTIKYARELVGIPYDYEFTNDPEKLYCTEYIKYIFLKSGITLDIFHSNAILYPKKFLESKDLEVIFTTNKQENE